MMKLENNWRQKTLESLMSDIRTALDSGNGSYLIKTCNSLCRKPLKDFTTEDLRVMIGQKTGLYYLIPLAIETLKKDLFAEGDMYEGDLLKNVLDVDTKFWNENRRYWQEINNMIKDRRDEIAKMNFDISKFEEWKR